MAGTVYDRHAAFYLDFVDRGLARQTGRANLLLSTLVDCLGERLSGARVLDLCCGEGYLGRYLLTRGARAVVGIDLSSALIEEAERRADSPALTYRVDDAQSLSSEAEGAFDVVVSQMAMMDVADHKSLFASVRRVLVRGGPFVFSLLHPCFMAPCHVTEAPPLTLDDAGRPLAVSVRRYATEGHWNSGGDGVRGHMGAYHRMVSTYVNDLIAGGFVLERLAEPLAGDDASQAGLAAEVPTVLVISARAA
jgi:SAM-dependent methyltransferase